VARAAIRETQLVASDELLAIGDKVKEILDEEKRMFQFCHGLEPADLLRRPYTRSIG
jgi:hypothetical protein